MLPGLVLLEEPADPVPPDPLAIAGALGALPVVPLLPEPALADFRKAWSLRQDESYAIGVSNILMDKKPGDAVTFLKEALNALPKSLFLRLSLARAYNKLDKTDEALGICNAILLEQPDQVNTLMLQTELFEKKGDASAVLKNLEKSYSLAPLNLEVAFKLAYQYAESKNGCRDYRKSRPIPVLRQCTRHVGAGKIYHRFR